MARQEGSCDETQQAAPTNDTFITFYDGIFSVFVFGTGISGLFSNKGTAVWVPGCRSRGVGAEAFSPRCGCPHRARPLSLGRRLPDRPRRRSVSANLPNT